MNIREPGDRIPGKIHQNANKPTWLHRRVQKHQIRVHATNCPTAPLNTTPPAPLIRDSVNILWRKFHADTWKISPEPVKESALHANETPLPPALKSAVHLPLNNPTVTPLIKAAHVGWRRGGYRRKIHWAPQSKPALSANPCVPSSKPWVLILRTSLT